MQLRTCIGGPTGAIFPAGFEWHKLAKYVFERYWDEVLTTLFWQLSPSSSKYDEEKGKSCKPQKIPWTSQKSQDSRQKSLRALQNLRSKSAYCYRTRRYLLLLRFTSRDSATFGRQVGNSSHRTQSSQGLTCAGRRMLLCEEPRYGVGLRFRKRFTQRNFREHIWSSTLTRVDIDSLMFSSNR